VCEKQLPKPGLKLPHDVIIINGSGAAADIIVTGLSNGFTWNLQAKQPHTEKGASVSIHLHF